VEISPEMKAQLEAQKKECIFCKLIRGEIPPKTIFEDDMTIAMLDIYPAVKGHCTYMLKEHYPLPAYFSGEEFTHMFALIPGLAAAQKKAMVMTGFNTVISMGGAAGQMSPHFLVHLFPREKGDGFFNFNFDKQKESTDENSVKMLAQNMPIMMKNHFGRNPASWHVGKGNVPAHLSSIYENGEVVYEDEKVLCVTANESLAKGHLIVYSKEEESLIENLSQESSAHLFFAASFASTAVFEGLGAHGTNIILKSGIASDNPDGRLSVHVIPRMQDDGQKIMWEPKQGDMEKLDGIASKIKDKTWKVNFDPGKKEEPKKVEEKKEKILISDGSVDNGKDEILNAINQFK